MLAVQPQVVNIQVATGPQMQPNVGNWEEPPQYQHLPRAQEELAPREDGALPRIKTIEQMMRIESLAAFPVEGEECILVNGAIRKLRAGLACLLEFCTSM